MRASEEAAPTAGLIVPLHHLRLHRVDHRGDVEGVVWVSRGDHLVDYLPVREPAEVAVVNEEVGLELATEVPVLLPLLGEVLIDGVEGDPSLLAPADGIVQQSPLTHRPEDQPMTIADQLPQGLDRTGYLITDSGVLMLHYGAIKVYCYYHRCKVKPFLLISLSGVYALCRGEKGEKEISPRFRKLS